MTRTIFPGQIWKEQNGATEHRFVLILSSENETVTGSTIVACHIWATDYIKATHDFGFKTIEVPGFGECEISVSNIRCIPSGEFNPKYDVSQRNYTYVTTVSDQETLHKVRKMVISRLFNKLGISPMEFVLTGPVVEIKDSQPLRNHFKDVCKEKIPSSAKIINIDADEIFLSSIEEDIGFHCRFVYSFPRKSKLKISFNYEKQRIVVTEVLEKFAIPNFNTEDIRCKSGYTGDQWIIVESLCAKKMNVSTKVELPEDKFGKLYDPPEIRFDEEAGIAYIYLKRKKDQVVQKRKRVNWSHDRVSLFRDITKKFGLEYSASFFGIEVATANKYYYVGIY